ncbi:uncharacterized protein LOC114029100 [Vombatus ursinus]|uniref:uncharacterized protein LOC114029100 n=1 Tax=Vombatus ursinus TaxID=29139 RepID=UPI000FFD9472|nr:uncharacterized protein LOC114029100 [Vombatus ursinus]
MLLRAGWKRGGGRGRLSRSEMGVGWRSEAPPLRRLAGGPALGLRSGPACGRFSWARGQDASQRWEETYAAVVSFQAHRSERLLGSGRARWAPAAVVRVDAVASSFLSTFSASQWGQIIRAPGTSSGHSSVEAGGLLPGLFPGLLRELPKPRRQALRPYPRPDGPLGSRNSTFRANQALPPAGYSQLPPPCFCTSQSTSLPHRNLVFLRFTSVFPGSLVLVLYFLCTEFSSQ